MDKEDEQRQHGAEQRLQMQEPIIDDDPLKSSNVHSVMSHASAPQHLIKFFQKEYQVLSPIFNLRTLHHSSHLKLKKYK